MFREMLQMPKCSVSLLPALPTFFDSDVRFRRTVVMRKMVHVVIELEWDTIEDEAEQIKPEDSDEELSLRLRKTCFMRNHENMTPGS